MADFWKQFPHSNFVNAGRSAFRADIHLQNNPYRFNGKPYCDLWDKGWRLERRKFEGIPNRSVAVMTAPAIQAVQRAGRPVGRPVRRPPIPIDRYSHPKPVGAARAHQVASLGTPNFERFNQRHRTAA